MLPPKAPEYATREHVDQDMLLPTQVTVRPIRFPFMTSNIIAGQ